MAGTLAQNANILSSLSIPEHPIYSSDASKEFFFEFMGNLSSVKMRTRFGPQLLRLLLRDPELG